MSTVSLAGGSGDRQPFIRRLIVHQPWINRASSDRIPSSLFCDCSFRRRCVNGSHAASRIALRPGFLPPLFIAHLLLSPLSLQSSPLQFGVHLGDIGRIQACSFLALSNLSCTLIANAVPVSRSTDPPHDQSPPKRPSTPPY